MVRRQTALGRKVLKAKAACPEHGGANTVFQSVVPARNISNVGTKAHVLCIHYEITTVGLSL